MNFLRRLIGQRPTTTRPLTEAPDTDVSAIKPATNGATPAAGNGSSVPGGRDNTAVTQIRTATSVMTTDASAEVFAENASAAEAVTTKPLDNNVKTQEVPASQTSFTMPGATRQLPPLEAFVAKPNKHITYGVNSDVGMVRTNNQDSLYAFFTTHVSAEDLPDFGLFVVADGMGGHHDGEKASAIASRGIARHVLENFYLKMLHPKNGEERPIVSEVLNEAVMKGNKMVSDLVPEGGTTATAIVILGDLAYIGHVGDSRAYLITAEGTDQITRDHSLVQRLIELDQLTQDEANNHPQRNVLYRALGQQEALEVDTITRRLPAGARLLLCSDGLWNLVPDLTLQQIVLSSKTPQEACDRLIHMANERGGQDNITVIVVQVPG